MAVLVILAMLVSPVGAAVCQMDCAKSQAEQAPRLTARGHTHSQSLRLRKMEPASHQHCGEARTAKCGAGLSVPTSTYPQCAAHGMVGPRQKVATQTPTAGPNTAPIPTANLDSLAGAALVRFSLSQPMLIRTAVLPLRI